MRPEPWWGQSGPLPTTPKLPGYAWFSPAQSIPTAFILQSRSCDLYGPQAGHLTHDHPAFASSRHLLLSTVHKLNCSFLENKGMAPHSWTPQRAPSTPLSGFSTPPTTDQSGAYATLKPAPPMVPWPSSTSTELSSKVPTLLIGQRPHSFLDRASTQCPLRAYTSIPPKNGRAPSRRRSKWSKPPLSTPAVTMPKVQWYRTSIHKSFLPLNPDHRGSPSMIRIHLRTWMLSFLSFNLGFCPSNSPLLYSLCHILELPVTTINWKSTPCQEQVVGAQELSPRPLVVPRPSLPWLFFLSS
jgi:hypothetical protein